MKRICVYCGSSPGVRQEYFDAAQQLGTAIAREKITLVYGAGSTGMMGVLADAVLEAGGEVIGVTPEVFLGMGVIHDNLTDLQVVQNMHQRKEQMERLADGFIALPGGLGTMEEFFEILTWSQLGFHQKPVGLLNTKGFYDPLQNFLNQLVKEGFVRTANLSALIVDTNPESLLAKLNHLK